jgi:PHD/YefM family antitoxin component YafN of YafNO toxin-antitoxin module
MLAKRSIRPTMPKGRYVTNRKGKRTGVVLSLKRYAQLMDDLHDLAIVAERKREKPVSADELKRRLRQRGHL